MNPQDADYVDYARTSGQKKCLFWAVGIGLAAKIVGKSQGKGKNNNALGKLTVFGRFLVH